MYSKFDVQVNIFFQSLDKAGIEQLLSEFFPDILGDLFDTLYDYMKKMWVFILNKFNAGHCILCIMYMY